MKYGVIFFLAIFLVASCATSRYSDAEIERFKKIENPLERWKAHNIQNYTYIINLTDAGEPTSEYKVFIQNSKVEKILEIKYGTWYGPQSVNTISPFDELINYAQLRMREHTPESMREDIPDIREQRVEYDEIYGYPTEFAFDNSNYCDHCYTFYEITDFEY